MDSISSIVLSKWATIKCDVPPAEDVLLYERDGCVIFVDYRYGPAIPYFGVDHGDGQFNYGYKRIKDDLTAVDSIPEVQGFEEFQRLLKAINDPSSPLESLGCEKMESPIEGHEFIKRRIGSYTDIAFSSVELCESAEANLELASTLLDSCKDCQQWWSQIEIGLQRLKYFNGAENPWGLMIRISGYGESPEQARQMWGVTADKLGSACMSFQNR